MKILVTGGAGYLGAAVVDRLVRTDHAVSVIDNLERGGAALVPWIGRIHVLVDDLVGSALGPFDVIIHLAAVVGERACMDEPDVAIRTNVEGTRAVCRTGARVVFASTCSNYGVCETMANEETPLNPLSLYAETKIQGEAMVRDAGGTVLRLATLCGPSFNTRLDLLINEAGFNMAHGLPTSIYAPQAWRPFLHVQDAADAIVVAALVDRPGTYNVVGDNVRKSEIASWCNSTVVEGVDDPRDYRVNSERFRREFEWKPKRTPRAAFADMVLAAPLLGVSP